MREPNFPRKIVSLGELLKANKEQFDRILATQKKEMGLMGLSRQPLTRE